MEYIRPKLQINRYKREPTHILFQKIAQEIDHETRTKLNFSLDYDLSLWLIRLMSLNPLYGIGFERTFNRTAIDALIKDYIKMVSEPDNKFVTIVKMQVYYMENCNQEYSLIAKRKHDLDEKLKPLYTWIINTHLKSKKDCNEYFKKLAADIIAYYSLGDAHNDNVMRETVMALKSMMSMNDVIAFSSLSDYDKMESLFGIREIVCGMRVFNKDAGHCGDGIIDIEETVRLGFQTTKFQLTTSIDEVKSRIEALVIRFEWDSSFWTPNNRLLLNKFENNEFIKSITLYRQCERFVYDLLSTLIELQLHAERNLKGFRNKMMNIHETVKLRIAVPITSIFPKFIELAKLWEQLQHQLYILSEINTVNRQLIQFTQIQPYDEREEQHPYSSDDTMTGNIGVKEDKAVYCNNQEPIEHRITNAAVKNESIRITPYQANIKIEYDGFCAWTLSVSNGLLLPSDLSIGLVNYLSRFYAFSTIEAAEIFMLDPDTCIRDILKTICHHPELALFFDIYDELKLNSQLNECNQNSNRNAIDEPKQCNAEIQTEIHPIPFNKTNNYSWDADKTMMKSFKLRNSRTRSTQTVLSAFRCEMGSQTILN